MQTGARRVDEYDLGGGVTRAAGRVGDDDHPLRTVTPGTASRRNAPTPLMVPPVPALQTNASSKPPDCGDEGLDQRRVRERGRAVARHLGQQLGRCALEVRASVCEVLELIEEHGAGACAAHQRATVSARRPEAGRPRRAPRSSAMRAAVW